MPAFSTVWWSICSCRDRGTKQGLLQNPPVRGLPSVRHFMKCYPIPGPKRPVDIKRNSLVEYGVDPINNDGMSPDTAQFEILLFVHCGNGVRMQIQDRPLMFNAFLQAIGNQTGANHWLVMIWRWSIQQLTYRLKQICGRRTLESNQSLFSTRSCFVCGFNDWMSVVQDNMWCIPEYRSMSKSWWPTPGVRDTIVRSLSHRVQRDVQGNHFWGWLMDWSTDWSKKKTLSLQGFYCISDSPAT